MFNSQKPGTDPCRESSSKDEKGRHVKSWPPETDEFLEFISMNEINKDSKKRKKRKEKGEMTANAPLFHGDPVNTSRIIYTPSDFAKISLLHLQEIGTLQATRPHVSKRENLSSYLFFIVLSGAGKLIYDKAEYELEAGSCVFIDCKRPYSHETSEDLWSLSWVHFNGPTAADIYRKYIERGGLPGFSPSRLDGYLNCFSNLYEIASSSSFTRDMEINAGLSQLLTCLMADSWHPEEAQPGTKKTGMIEIRKYLDENYSEKITLDDLAERYFINKYYLTRVFKEQFGVSVMDYLLGVRITKAKNLLRFSNMTADEIGQATGIGDQYYFSRVFKKVEGIGIREYRKQWGEPS